MTNINKQDRKKLCLERAVLFISNLWELSDKELDTIKDLALQGGVTERICLSVQNCNSKAETSYRFNLKGPMLSLTLNPPSTEAHTCVRLLLLLSSIRAVNPAQSLITKRRRKKHVLVISFRLWTPAGQRCLSAIPGEAPNWQKECLPTTEVVFLHPLPSSSPCLQFSCFGSNSELLHSTHAFFRELRHSAYNSSLRGQDLKI